MSYRNANQLRQSFNLVTQQDSRVMWQDNQTMKAIAFITLLFLPMATVAVSTVARPTARLRVLALPTEDHLYKLSLTKSNRLFLDASSLVSTQVLRRHHSESLLRFGYSG
jgi:hypothetical protein